VLRRAALAARPHTAIWRRVWALSFATAGAAAIALLFLHAPAGPSKSKPIAWQPAQETITSKGLQPSLGLYRKTAAGVERLGAAARVHPGDIVQVRYIAAGRSYGVVASCDAGGAVTLHLPEAPGQAVALVKDGERALAHAYEFDNSPGFRALRVRNRGRALCYRPGGAQSQTRRGVAQSFTSWSISLQKETP